MFFTDLKRGGNCLLIATAVATFLYVIGVLKANVLRYYFLSFSLGCCCIKEGGN